MNLNPSGWASLVVMVLAAIYLGHLDDPRMWNWIKELWSNTVGAWFTRRRLVGSFTDRRVKLHRIGKPDEHSKGIMTHRRDVNAGWWS